MPQLDASIFFLESLSLIISFFSLVFYNQYVFYPRVLKHIFVRRYILRSEKTAVTLKFLIKKLKFLFRFDLYFFKTSIVILNKLIFKKINLVFKKINLLMAVKFNLIIKHLNLILSKFIWVFIRFRAFMLNYDTKI